MQRPCALLCLAAAVSAFQPPAARSRQLTQMYGFDNPASRPKYDLSVQSSNGTPAWTVSCTICDTRRCRVVDASSHSLTQYAILEESYMFKVLWGTNEEGGWSKPQSVKWALVYDLRHEGWGETYMEKPLFVPQYDDISDAEEDLGGKPGIPVYKPDHPGLEFIAPTETAEQTQARRRSERLSQVAPHTYKEGRSNERRRSASVPTRPKHGGGAAETPVQPGATSEEEGFTLLNKQGTEEEDVVAAIVLI